jgi:hypothetical protein
MVYALWPVKPTEQVALYPLAGAFDELSMFATHVDPKQPSA